MMQYQIIVNGTKSEVWNSLPAAQWDFVALNAEERGVFAQLLRRSVYDDLDILPCIADDDGNPPKGTLIFGNRVALPWQVWAELDFRSS